MSWVKVWSYKGYHASKLTELNTKYSPGFNIADNGAIFGNNKNNALIGRYDNYNAGFASK